MITLGQDEKSELQSFYCKDAVKKLHQNWKNDSCYRVVCLLTRERDTERGIERKRERGAKSNTGPSETYFVAYDTQS